MLQRENAMNSLSYRVVIGCFQSVWGLVFAPTWFAAELIIRKFLLIKRQPLDLDERFLSRLTRHVDD